jgi:hypothetical protein
VEEFHNCRTLRLHWIDHSPKKRKKFSTQSYPCTDPNVCMFRVVVNCDCYDSQNSEDSPRSHGITTRTVPYVGRAALHKFILLALLFSVYGTGNSDPKRPAAPTGRIDSFKVPNGHPNNSPRLDAAVAAAGPFGTSSPPPSPTLQLACVTPFSESISTDRTGIKTASL